MDNNEILDSLVNLNADDWNISVASQLGISVDLLKELITSKELQIAESRIEAHITKKEIEELSDDQLVTDNNNKKAISNGQLNRVYQSTILDKYTVSVNDSNSILVESIAITGKIIIGFDFSASDLSNSYFCGCLFYNCSFNNVSLENSVISGCIFNTCDLSGCDFTGSSISRTQIFQSNCINTAIEYSVITDSVIISVDMRDISFNQSKILYTGFSECNISASDWKDTDIIQCTFTDCTINESDFRRSTIVDCILLRVSFESSDFTSVIVSCLSQVKCKYDEKFSYLFEMDHLLYTPSLFEWGDIESNDEDGDEDGDDEPLW